MHPALVITLAAATALPLGLWLRHDLNKLGYRTADEQHLPRPGPRWWVVCSSVLALGSLAAAASLSGKALAYLPLFPLAVAGPWLAAVDFDVLRIPNRVLFPTAVATLVATGATAAATQDWRTLIAPAAAALVTGGALTAVHFASRGGIGFGDVKLATLIALAVGLLGIGSAWLSILAGSAAALLGATLTRRAGPIPYGPGLLWGCWLAAISSSLAA